MKRKTLFERMTDLARRNERDTCKMCDGTGYNPANTEKPRFWCEGRGYRL